MAVCQDEIGGPRAKTVAAARAALASGACVIVDRTHLARAQRADFVRLASEVGSPCHAVVLDLPAKECKVRAASRESHPSGVAGARAFSVVSRLAGEVEWPRAAAAAGSAGEGFASVMRCSDDAEANMAARAWARYREGGGQAAVDEAWRAAMARPRGIKRFFSPSSGAAAGAEGGGAPPPSSPPAKRAAAAQPEQQRQEPPLPKPPPAAAADDRNPPPPPPPPHLAALVRAARDPQADPRVLYWDDQVVLLPDAYPKAERHALVLARGASFSGPEGVAALRAPRDLPLLRRMAAVGFAWAARASDGKVDRAAIEAAAREADDEGGAGGGGGGDDKRPLHPPSGFRAGFHALPSMPQLHLHVFSDDLRSPCMKKRQHYSSFLPPFFLDLEEVEEGLRGHKEARVVVDAAAAGRAKERSLAQLPCHRCGATFGSWAGTAGLMGHLQRAGAGGGGGAGGGQGGGCERREGVAWPSGLTRPDPIARVE